MRSAYDEAQSFGGYLERVFDREIYETASKISDDNDKFDNGKIFGMMIGLNRAKEIIASETNFEMAKLINDKREYDNMIEKLKEIDDGSNIL